MQRLGFLKHLEWRASLASTNTLSTLGKELISSVSQKISFFSSHQIQKDIKATLTDQTYKNLPAIVSNTLSDNLDNPKVQIELQDFYLGNSELPSRRGKLVNDDWNKYPYLALNLGLLRKGTYSLLVRGQSFLSLVNDSERKAFGRSGDKPLNEGLNPLQLTIPQRLLLLFSFIEGDGDVLKDLYRRLLPISKEFSDSEAGDYLPDIYRSIVKQARPKVRSGDDNLRIQKLLDVAGKIEEWKGKQSTGGKDARLHTITPRLEPLVDLSLLSKPDPFAYRYQVTHATKIFFDLLINSESIDNFLHFSFFKAANKAINLNSEHRPDRETIFPEIQKAYTALKSPLGYTSILEVSLLAGIYSITESGAYFELSEAINLLKSLQKEKPELVRFNVDRWGTLTFVKFNSDIMKTVGG